MSERGRLWKPVGRSRRQIQQAYADEGGTGSQLAEAALPEVSLAESSGPGTIETIGTTFELKALFIEESL